MSDSPTHSRLLLAIPDEAALIKLVDAVAASKSIREFYIAIDMGPENKLALEKAAQLAGVAALELFPFIAFLARLLPRVLTEREVPVHGVVELSRLQVSCIIACMFLGVLPPQPEGDAAYNTRHMRGLLQVGPREVTAHMLACVLHYFNRLLEMWTAAGAYPPSGELAASLAKPASSAASAASAAAAAATSTASGGAAASAVAPSPPLIPLIPAGSVYIRRVEVSADLEPSTCPAPVVPLIVHSEGGIDDLTGGLQADFANERIGGGVLVGGCVQEEIRFITCTEALVSMALEPVMGPREAIIITGAERFSTIHRYGLQLKFGGDCRDTTPRFGSAPTAVAAAATAVGAGTAAAAESMTDAVTATGGSGAVTPGTVAVSIAAIDALPYVGMRNPLPPQLKQKSLRRETLKAYAGFSAVGPEVVATQGVATGRWGCGVFNGNDVIKLTVQWIACSMAGRTMHFYPFTQQQLIKPAEEASAALAAARSLAGGPITAGHLYTALVEVCAEIATEPLRTPQLSDIVERAISVAQRQPRAAAAAVAAPGDAAAAAAASPATPAAASPGAVRGPRPRLSLFGDGDGDDHGHGGAGGSGGGGVGGGGGARNLFD